MQSLSYRLVEAQEKIEFLRNLCLAQEKRLSLIEQLILNLPAEKKKITITEVSINLPDHIRRTYDTLKKFTCASAGQVAEITKRTRTIESAYLNQLCILGITRKRKEGRKTLFSIAEENPPLETLEA